MKKIKVLHIAQSNGGVAEYLKMFFKYADRNNFEIDLLCSNQYNEEKNFFRHMGYKITIMDMKREISPLSDIKAILEIISYIKETKPDVIHLHSSKAGVLGRVAALFFHIPVVYNSHGWAFDMNVSDKKRKLYAFIERVCAKFTDKIITISKYEKDIALQYNICSENKIQIIYNGIDIDKYSKSFDVEKIKNELHIPENAFIIGMVGRITRQKSPETFVEIANILSRKISNSYFVFVGDGELREEIMLYIKEKNLVERVKITGWTNEVSKYISIFDVGVLTSKWEGFGLVLTEYMASKKPVVASKVGGITSVINDGHTGFMVDKDSVEQFCNKILILIDDIKLKQELIENAYNDVVKRFDIKRVVYEHEKVYKNLCDR